MTIITMYCSNDSVFQIAFYNIIKHFIIFQRNCITCTMLHVFIDFMLMFSVSSVCCFVVHVFI